MAIGTTATKFSMMSTKFQVGAAALAVATATSFTPALAPTAEAIGEGLGSGLNSAIFDATPMVPCAGQNPELLCYAVQGAAAGTEAFVRGTVIFLGTTAYVIVQGTGQVLKLVGAILPGPIGDAFDSVGDGVLVFANNIAESLRVGPYLSA